MSGGKSIEKRGYGATRNIVLFVLHAFSYQRQSIQGGQTNQIIKYTSLQITLIFLFTVIYLLFTVWEACLSVTLVIRPDYHQINQEAKNLIPGRPMWPAGREGRERKKSGASMPKAELLSNVKCFLLSSFSYPPLFSLSLSLPPIVLFLLLLSSPSYDHPELVFGALLQRI